MNKPNESSTIYDFAGSEYEAPAVEPVDNIRVVNWQSADNFKRKEALKQQHVRDAMEMVQPDNSKMAWWRLFTGQRAADQFEIAVNDKFGGKPRGGFNYEEKKAQYISFYKQAMENL